jgi:hypothetical protein
VRANGFVWTIAAALLVVCAGSGATTAQAQVTAGAAALGGIWGSARELPGLGSLNVNEGASVLSVSCATPTNCGAGGRYSDVNGQLQPFVTSELNGRWHTVEVPVIGLANSGNGETVSVSCPTATSCSAGGYYTDDSSQMQAFVVTERNGAWRNGEEVPGLREMNAGGNAMINSVSCWAAGSCVASGFYTDQAGHQQGFVVFERAGRWRAATTVPGLARLNRGGSAQIYTVSCAAGGCTAAGWYAGSAGHRQAVVASERGGKWGKAAAVPGLARLNRGGFADVVSVSCPTAVSCGATGLYTDGRGHTQSFVATRNSGRWGSALEIPGLARLNVGGDAESSSASCWATGGYSGVGVYEVHQNSDVQGFVVSEK